MDQLNVYWAGSIAAVGKKYRNQQYSSENMLLFVCLLPTGPILENEGRTGRPITIQMTCWLPPKIR